MSNIEEIVILRHPLGTIEYTKSALERKLSDFNFLKDAFLILLNSDVAEKSDIIFNKRQALEGAKEMYLNSDYNKEFIEECFANITY